MQLFNPCTICGHKLSDQTCDTCDVGCDAKVMVQLIHELVYRDTRNRGSMWLHLDKCSFEQIVNVLLMEFYDYPEEMEDIARNTIFEGNEKRMNAFFSSLPLMTDTKNNGYKTYVVDAIRKKYSRKRARESAVAMTYWVKNGKVRCAVSHST